MDCSVSLFKKSNTHVNLPIENGTLQDSAAKHFDIFSSNIRSCKSFATVTKLAK